MANKKHIGQSVDAFFAELGELEEVESRMIRVGRYECEGQAPIVVVECGGFSVPEGHGPWVRYRFEHEPDAQALPVYWEAFRRLIDDTGYRWKGLA